jgi:glutamine amidotransferase
MIVIVDYDVGNLESIRNMLKKVGKDAIISKQPEMIANADKLILPGVGHFDRCMSSLRQSAYFDIFKEKVLINNTPLLAICVGCQMLMEESEEGVEKGLGWIKGKVVRFDERLLNPTLKIPHMGWTEIIPRGEHVLFDTIEDPRYYFVHSYHLQCKESEDISSEAWYGYDFPASVKKGNIYGVQFHPEKSHKFGLKLFQNFSGL